MFICYRNKLEHSIYWFKYVFCFEIIRSLQSSWLFNRLTFCSNTARFSTSSRTFPSNSIFSLYKLIFHVSTDNVANFTRGQFLCHFGVIKCTTVFCHPIVTFFVFDPVWPWGVFLAQVEKSWSSIFIFGSALTKWRPLVKKTHTILRKPP